MCYSLYDVLETMETLGFGHVGVVTICKDLPLRAFISFFPSVEFDLRREIRRLKEYRKAGIKSFCSESTLTFSLLCSTKLHFKVAWLSRKCIYIQTWAMLSSLVWVWLLSGSIIICGSSNSTVYLVFKSLFYNYNVLACLLMHGTQSRAQQNVFLSCIISYFRTKIRDSLAN